MTLSTNNIGSIKMSAALNPTYWSKSAEASKFKICGCCEDRVHKSTLRMIEGEEICNDCFEEFSQDVIDAGDSLTKFYS